MDIGRLCLNCMSEIKEGARFCVKCGYDSQSDNTKRHALKPLSVLKDKYVVGNVIGEGGFGITYVGMDKELELKVAIKEFFPVGFVSRDNTISLTVNEFTNSNAADIQKWKEGFIKEARALAKCVDLPGIVGVREYFEENRTAYIVMEFVEGQTLKSYCKDRGGRIKPEEAFDMLRLIIESLQKVHNAGVIHRDISPDNLMVLPQGGLKLIDFGAARNFGQGAEKSKSVMLKPGYAPQEQYSTHGNQGPWSDVYAIAATLYRCITGSTPIESMERIRNDALKSPLELGIFISTSQNQALMKALSVYPEDRYQSMSEFAQALYNTNTAPQGVSLKKDSDGGQTEFVGKTGSEDETVFMGNNESDKTEFIGGSIPNHGMNIPSQRMGMPGQEMSMANQGISMPNQGMGMPNQGTANMNSATNETVVLFGQQGQNQNMSQNAGFNQNNGFNQAPGYNQGVGYNQNAGFNQNNNFKTNNAISASNEKKPKKKGGFVALVIVLVVILLILAFLVGGVMAYKTTNQPNLITDLLEQIGLIHYDTYEEENPEGSEEDEGGTSTPKDGDSSKDGGNEESEPEEDVAELDWEQDFDALISRLKNSGSRSTSKRSKDIDELTVAAGNWMCAEYESSGQTKHNLTLSEKKLKKLKLEPGSCVLDDENEIYDNDEYMLVRVPCFYGAGEGVQYSGRLEVVYAKQEFSTSRKDFDYTPMYVNLIQDGGITGKPYSSISASSGDAGKLHDMNIGTAWTAKKTGNQSISIKLGSQKEISGIIIVNGNCSSDSSFYSSGQVTSVTIDFGYVQQTYSLNTDTKGEIQLLSAKELVETSEITVYINDSTGGKPSISEVFVY